MQHSFSVTNGSALNASSSYHLSIQSDLSGLCFCVLDLDAMQYVALQSLTFQPAVVDYNDLQQALERTLGSEPLLNLRFSSVACMHVSRSATLIPNVLSDEVLLKSFLEFNAPFNELDEVHHHPIPSFDAEAVFSVPSPLAGKLAGKYGRVKFFHQCAPLLAQLPEQARHSKHGEVLAVNIHHAFADVALYARGGLKIYNTFELQAPTDLVYFMLAVARQHKVNEKKMRVLLSGHTGRYEGEVGAFFPTLALATPSPQHPIAPELADVADHRFTLLFSLYPCAS